MIESPLRVCIDARIISGTVGGVEQFIIGLASGLSKLLDGDEEYLFLSYAGADEWLRPYIQWSCRMLYGQLDPRQLGWHRSLKQSVKSSMPLLYDAWRKLPVLPGLRPSSPKQSNGTIEKAGAAIMHFTAQGAFITSVP